jgi:hypothetical protein
MDTNIVDLHIAIARLQAMVEAGFTGVKEEFEGVHSRLDKLNGRVYDGEKEQSDIRERVARLEERKAPPSKAALIATAGGAAAATGGFLTALWEAIKPFLSNGKQ